MMCGGRLRPVIPSGGTRDLLFRTLIRKHRAGPTQKGLAHDLYQPSRPPSPAARRWLCPLGPRAQPTLAEVGARIGGMPCILGLLGEYQQRLSPRLLRAVGGDRFPARPLRVVPR